jgi:hypothetical protein
MNKAHGPHWRSFLGLRVISSPFKLITSATLTFQNDQRQVTIPELGTLSHARLVSSIYLLDGKLLNNA